MPFRFAMRKAKRYEVSTKNSYIVCVHLLDTVLIECTLNAESTGQDCLENISTRIGLNEIQYFGLRYLNKKTLEFRWVDLEKPLKKQLEKNAQSALLYFGVMFCIGDILQIKDEMSRYQYYLHLKTEIIDCRLQCTLEQARLLAAYSIQAEIGDYNSEKHGPDYLSNMVLFPQNISSEDHVVQQLTQEVAALHQQLRGVPPSTAKLQYIMEAQELEGYGMEFYLIKDHGGQDLLLGTSFVGVFVKPRAEKRPTVYFKWSDIVNFSHNKRQVGIETKLSDKPFHFMTDSVDYAKYIYKMCCRQQKFYKANSHLQATPSIEEREGEDFSLPSVEEGHGTTMLDMQQDVLPGQEHDMNPSNLAISEYLQSVNESSHTVIINESSSLSEEQLPESTYLIGMGEHGATSIQAAGMQGISVPSITNAFQHELPVGTGMTYTVTGFNSPTSNIIQPAGITRLPSYRPPPDYKTIMCQKMDRMMEQTQQQQRSIMGNLVPEMLTYSQPDIHQMPVQYAAYYNNGQIYIDRPSYVAVERIQGYHPGKPVDRTSSLIVYPTSFQHKELPTFHRVDGMPALERPVYVGVTDEVLDYQPGRPVDRSTSLTVYPSAASANQAEVHSGILQHMQNVPDVAALFQHRLPPPYPRQSTSTPDLALQATNAVSHSSPDLASCHTRPKLIVQSRFDQSMENLALDAQQLQLCQLHSSCSKDNINSSSSSQVDFSRSGQMSFPDVTRNTVVSNASRNMPAAAVDLSRLAMLRHFEKQNQAYLQSIAGKPTTVSSEEYMKQLHLQEAFRNIHLNANMSEQKSSRVPQAEELLMSVSTGSGINYHGIHQNGVISTSSPNHSGAHVMEFQNLSSQWSETAPSRNQPNNENTQIPQSLTTIGGCDDMETEKRRPKDEPRRTLESKLEEGQVFAEFEQVPKKHLKCDCSTAVQEANRSRNRFKDVVPYEDNRVRLKPTAGNPSGYINASHIRVKVGASEFWYIAAQGPLPNTVVDFWHMVWENEVRVIAMLTGLNDPEQRKCAKYWPDKLGTESALKFGDFRIAVRYINECWSYVTRGLILRHDPSRTERLIWHLQYTEWPDHGCPNNHSGFLEYLDELSAIKRQVSLEKNSLKPTCVVVHCSAGVGRTGVLILTEMMKTTIEHNGKIDVPQALKSLREQRMHMVQTVSQYSFVYQMIALYLQSSRLI